MTKECQAILDKMNTLSKSSLPFIQVKPEELSLLMSHVESLTEDLKARDLSNVVPVDRSLPIVAQMLFHNLDIEIATILAQDLELISPRDNPDLKDYELKQLWWLRSEYQQKNDKLIKATVENYPDLLAQPTKPSQAPQPQQPTI